MFVEDIPLCYTIEKKYMFSIKHRNNLLFQSQIATPRRTHAKVEQS